jgi:hypothetical protein
MTHYLNKNLPPRAEVDRQVPEELQQAIAARAVLAAAEDIPACFSEEKPLAPAEFQHWLTARGTAIGAGFMQP